MSIGGKATAGHCFGGGYFFSRPLPERRSAVAFGENEMVNTESCLHCSDPMTFYLVRQRLHYLPDL